MAHVIMLNSINEDMFICGQCKYVFNNLDLFLEHKRWKCDKLEQEKNLNKTALEIVDLDKNTAYNLHDRSILQGDNVFENNNSCKVCMKKFKKVSDLLSHMKIHTEKFYQCPVCGRCFSQNSHLQRHISTHKVWVEDVTETTARTEEVDLLSYSCTYCSQNMSSYNKYRSHLKTHLDFKKYKCIQNRCSSFHETIDSLLEHVLTGHNLINYECHVCGSIFNSLESIAVHQQTHSKLDNFQAESKQYKCSQCDAVFKKHERLSLHLLRENHKKMCIHCNKIFASDKRLRLHLQIHRKSKPFQCDICGSSFHMKKYLTSHMLKHGDRGFHCQICQVTFKRQDLLQRHMKLHLMEKKFQCPYKASLNCKREFSRSDKLKSHIKWHSKLNASLNITKCETL